jgi:threonyl-tRNA synthetase
MLQRIYGVTFPRQEQLDEFLHKLEEAKRRDHRRLGKELELFTFFDEIGPGLPIWLPKGARMRMIMEEFIRAELLKHHYEFVYTPHVARERLWEVSGHLTWYRENMFAGMDVEGQQYLVRPMNCPFHIMVYASKTRSYRDLPLKFTEFGTIYRYERSGVLHGMTRVRGATQDDAHIFCRPDQVKAEVSELLDLAFLFLRAFGFEDFHLALSLHDPARRAEYAGQDEDWQQAEGALESVLRERELPYERMIGEAQFYGPKIDLFLRDALDRSCQCSTIQFDFTLPGRFRLTYMGEDGV